MSTLQDTNANRSIFWGSIAGTIYVLMSYAGYEILGIKYMMGFWKSIPYAIVIGIMIYTGIEKRKELGGYINFKTALSHMFVVLIIAEVCYTIYLYALYNWINPMLADQMKAEVIDAMQTFSAKLNLSASKMEDSIAEIEKEDMHMTIPRAALTTAISICISFFVAAAGALIIRKNPPPSLESEMAAQDQSTS